MINPSTASGTADSHKAAVTSYFQHRTWDLIFSLYLVLIVSLWVGQSIDALTFETFTYTTPLGGYCSLDPIMKSLNTSVIQKLYTTAQVNNPNVPYNCDTGEYRCMVEDMVVFGAGVATARTAQGTFNIITAAGRDFCVGPAHFSVAFNLDPPDIKYSSFWEAVRENRDSIYGNEPDSSVKFLAFNWLTPLWVMFGILLTWHLYVCVQHWMFETKSMNRNTPRVKKDHFFTQGVVGYTIPTSLDIVAAALLITKITGINLTRNEDIYWITGVFMLSLICRWLPYAWIQIRLTLANITPILTNNNVPTMTSPLRIHRYITFASRVVFMYVILIVTIYISQDLENLTFEVLNNHCGTGTQSIDSCILPSGRPYHARNANVILAYLSPVIVFAAMRFCMFCWYMVYTNNTSNDDLLTMDLTTGIADITEYRILSNKDQNGESRFRIFYTTILEKSSIIQRRVVYVGRFLVPISTFLTVALLSILKLSQYAFWDTLPWWAIGTIMTSAIGVGILTDMIQSVKASMNPGFTFSNTPSGQTSV